MMPCLWRCVYGSAFTILTDAMMPRFMAVWHRDMAWWPADDVAATRRSSPEGFAAMRTMGERSAKSMPY